MTITVELNADINNGRDLLLADDFDSLHHYFGKSNKKKAKQKSFNNEFGKKDCKVVDCRTFYFLNTALNNLNMCLEYQFRFFSV